MRSRPRAQLVGDLVDQVASAGDVGVDDATETEFFERVDMLDTEVGADKKDDPAEIADQGFDLKTTWLYQAQMIVSHRP
jgi:hypothetical protein